MGYVSIILGFAVLIVLSVLDISVFVGGVAAALIVIFMTGMPVVETITDVYYVGFGGIFTTFFPMFLFGAILAKLYANSGAALSISSTICGKIFRKGESVGKNFSKAFLAVIIASAILCYGGINSGVAIVTIYPIALGIFAAAGIPKKFIMGAICGGAFTFALCGPGSPQLTNVAGMTLGTSSSCGLIAGIAAIAAEAGVMVFLLSKMAVRAARNGESFFYGSKDVIADEQMKRPGFWVSLFPMLFLLVIFNAFQVNIIIATMLTCVLTILLFGRYLSWKEIFASFQEGALSALLPCGCMGSVVGFAAVVQETEAFQTMIHAVLNMKIQPVLLIILSVACICALTGGSTTGFKIALPIISPGLLEKGVSPELIHRVGAFASTTMDSLPHSGAVIMAISMADLKMKDAYPAVFATTTIATICGVTVAAVIMSLFPFLP